MPPPPPPSAPWSLNLPYSFTAEGAVKRFIIGEERLASFSSNNLFICTSITGKKLPMKVTLSLF